MSSIFNIRRLSSYYSIIDVITESSAVKTVDGYLKLRAGLNFGAHGRLTRNKTIKLSATDLVTVTKELKVYENSILEIIGIFEQATLWAKRRFAVGELPANSPAAFTTFVLEEEFPLMVHAIHKGRSIEIQVYGAGLKSLVIDLDCRGKNKDRLFLQRMNEIIETFRSHLFDIDQVNFLTVMEGVSA